MISRRNILYSGAAVIAMPLGLASCPQAIQKFEADWNNFVDQVNAILSQGCGLVPGFIAQAKSIAAVVSVFFPTAQAAIAVGSAAVQAVASAICGMVPSAPPAALAARLQKAAATRIPTIVGNVNINGQIIPITGYGVGLRGRYHR